jgi:hypothetical protein
MGMFFFFFLRLEMMPLAGSHVNFRPSDGLVESSFIWGITKEQ